MRTTITRKYSFEAAHRLPNVPSTHKCFGMHGHNYEVEITCGGFVDSRGFVLDFFELDQVVNPLIEILDHKVLNEIKGLENPTSEIIGQWFLDRVMVASRVRVYETSRCWADVSR